MKNRSVSEPDADLFHFAADTPQNDDALEGELASARATIKEKLSHTAIAIDELIRLTELDSSLVQTVILELELAGEITRHAGNRVSFC